MARKRKTITLRGAQIVPFITNQRRAYERDRWQWERVTLPAARKEARRLGATLETTVKVHNDWGIFWNWEFSAKLIRKPKVPKPERPLCGARCRNGQPCKARVTMRPNGIGGYIVAQRCRLHGGLSTGPKTAAGRGAIVESNRRRRGMKYKKRSA